MGDPGNLPRLAALAWTGPLVGWAGPALRAYAERRRIADAFTPGNGLKLIGNAADQRAYLVMVRREMLRSNRFYVLMLAINADQRNPVEVTVGRNQNGITVDAFDSAARKSGAQELDLADLAKLPVDPPPDQPNAATQGEILIHAMSEAKEGANTADYGAAHGAGIKAQNDYRDERGQKGHRPASDKDPETYGAGDWTLFYDNGYRERWERNGNSITNIVRDTATP